MLNTQIPQAVAFKEATSQQIPVIKISVKPPWAFSKIL
jgi:cellulose biosynthesis protein BcsQ